MKFSPRESKEANVHEAGTTATCCMIQGSPCPQGEIANPQFVTHARHQSTQNQILASCYRYFHIQKISLLSSPRFIPFCCGQAVNSTPQWLLTSCLPGRVLVACIQQMLKELRKRVSGRAKEDQVSVIFPRDSSEDREEFISQSHSALEHNSPA